MGAPERGRERERERERENIQAGRGPAWASASNACALARRPTGQGPTHATAAAAVKGRPGFADVTIASVSVCHNTGRVQGD